MSGQIYKKRRLLYQLTGNRLYFIAERCLMEITADEQQGIHINSTQPKDVIEWLELKMGYQKK